MRPRADRAAAERAALEAAFATGKPFTGLRGHRRDPALDAVVPPALARRLRVVPLTLEDGVLRVAVADPQADLTPLTARLGGRRLAVTLAPATEIDDLLAPPRRTRLWLLGAAAVLAAAALAIALVATTGDDTPGAERAGSTTPAVADPAQSAAQPPPPAPPPRPLTVAVAVAGGTLPPALAQAWPSDTAAHPASSRADALAALCSDSAGVAILDTPPTGAERADAGCALATAAEVTVGATVLRAPGGGCLRAPRARTLARHPPKRPEKRARPLAIRNRRGDCIHPTPADVGSGAYPLTRRVALVTGPAGAPPALTAAPRIRPRVTTITVRRLR